MYGVMIHRLAGLYDLRVAVNRLGVLAHDIYYRRGEEGLSQFLHCPTNIAVGNNSYQRFVFHHNAYAQFSIGDHFNRFTQRHIRTNKRQVLCEHYLFYFRQQLPSQVSARMQLCKVRRLEMFRFHECTRECVAKRQGSCRARCRDEIQRIGLARYRDIQMNI